jgi:hypothetical protein
MRSLCRFNVIRLLACTMLLILPAASNAQQRPEIAEKIAQAYGLNSFGQIEAIRYTFNLQLPALNVNLSRSWVWEPKTGQISYEGKDKDGKLVKATYIRSQVNSAPDNIKNEIDPAFNNDQYWLIFPFHVFQDASSTVTDEGMQKLPIGEGSATRVVVKYPSQAGGYTPGDTWTLYIGPDYRIREMDYHRGGPRKPTEVIVTWAGYKKAGPLLVSTDHRGTADGKPCHVFFSGVAYKLTGSDKWIDAK